MASMTPDEIRAVLDAHTKWLCGDDGERADLRGADLSWADLSDSNLRGANLRGADLRWANMREANLREANLRGADLSLAYLSGADLSGTGVCRVQDDEYEATLYPGTDGPELAYGCERHQLSHWEANVEQIASKHLPADALAAKVEQLRALFAYLHTIPQPKFSEEVSRG